MNCPHCNREIPDATIQTHAARIARANRREPLTSEQARAMAERSHAARRANKAAKE